MIDERYSSSQWSALHGHGMACAHGAMRIVVTTVCRRFLPNYLTFTDLAIVLCPETHTLLLPHRSSPPIPLIGEVSQPDIFVRLPVRRSSHMANVRQTDVCRDGIVS